MKNLAYSLIKVWIKASLYLYFGRIKVSGLENVPKDGPVMFLPNHQNALIDVLLLAVDCNRKPYFLTRSDVFRNKMLGAVFNLFQMIPIYRIRDGRQSLKNNQAIFNQCAKLLKEDNALLLFPEANHNLKRRVRPLSKGFTRILFAALEVNPQLNTKLVPVGLNYKNAVSFPDKVMVNFGKPIAVQDLYTSGNEKVAVENIKEAVFEKLKSLTGHIEDEESYEAIITKLDAFNIDYTNAEAVNEAVSELKKGKELVKRTRGTSVFKKVLRLLFTVLNLPMVMLWRYVIKPKVWEPEFMATLRFAFCLIGYPICYTLIVLVFSLTGNASVGLEFCLGLFVFNGLFKSFI